MPTNGAAATRREDWLESIALSASMLCLVHCLALPLVIAALPVLSSALAIPESFHLWVLAFAIPASGTALVTGRAKHGAHAPLLAGLAWPGWRCSRSARWRSARRAGRRR